MNKPVLIRRNAFRPAFRHSPVINPHMLATMTTLDISIAQSIAQPIEEPILPSLLAPTPYKTIPRNDLPIARPEPRIANAAPLINTRRQGRTYFPEAR